MSTPQEALDLGPQKTVTRLGHKYTGESKGDYFYSFNGEDYEGEGQPTREGALAEAQYERGLNGAPEEGDEEDDGVMVWTGRGVTRSLAALADGETAYSQILEAILERARENAYEWVGDHAENFLSDAWGHHQELPEAKAMGAELRYALMVAIDQWADRHNLQPQFFGIEDVEGP